MASDKRVKVTLACAECKQRNYNTMKNKKNDPDRLEMNKYCRFCKKHTTPQGDPLKFPSDQNEGCENMAATSSAKAQKPNWLQKIVF